MKTKLFIAFIFILLLSSVSAKPVEEELAIPLKKVWAAVQNDIAWQRWRFNTFVGEKEYEKNIGEIKKVRFIFDPHIFEEDDGGIPVREFRGDDYSKARRTVIYVHIEKSPIVYKIIGYPEIDSLPSKAYSVINHIEPKQLPKLGMWKSEKILSIRIPPITDYNYYPLKQMSEDTVLLNMIKRSLALYIQDYYFDGNPYLSTKLKRDPITLVNFENRVIAFRLGAYSDDDPRLLIYCENTKEYLFTEFPNKKIFNDPTKLMCFYGIDSLVSLCSKNDNDAIMKYLNSLFELKSKEFAFHYDDYVNEDNFKK